MNKYSKLLKSTDDVPNTLWSKLKNKYWEIRWWIGDTRIGIFYQYRISMKYIYPVRCWFNPRHKKLRKSIPKTWIDSSELVRMVNFAIITEFYEDEFTNGFIDWDSDEQHREFSKWITEAYKYITITRPGFEEQMLASYPKHKKSISECKNLSEYFSEFDGIPYEDLYGQVCYWENMINDRDNKILTELVSKYKGFLWT